MQINVSKLMVLMLSSIKCGYSSDDSNINFNFCMHKTKMFAEIIGIKK